MDQIKIQGNFLMFTESGVQVKVPLCRVIEIRSADGTTVEIHIEDPSEDDGRRAITVTYPFNNIL
jgi:hypothetical protein